MKSTMVFLLSLVLSVCAAEFVVRQIGWYTTYSERIGNGTVSYYGQTHPTWFHRWEPGMEYTFIQPEYTYTYRANSHGFRDEEWRKEKPDSVRRLFVVGDSFVEGDGVPYGDAITDHLRVVLDSVAMISDCHWEVRNAGVCGSDVFYARMLVEHLLVEFDHDAILLVINDSDLDDYLFRGGMERFLADTTTRFRDGPWWQSLFRYSHVFRSLMRVFDIKDDRLVSSEEKQRIHNASLPLMVQTLKSLNQLCHEREIGFMVIVHPFPWQVADVAGNFDGEELEMLDAGENVLDSQNYFHSTFANMPAMLEDARIPFVDVAVNMNQQLGHLPLEDFGWPVNGHFNVVGYRAMARAIYAEVSKRDPDFFCVEKADLWHHADTPMSDMEK